MKEPSFRCRTIEATKAVCLDLGIPFDSLGQDWPYDTGDLDDIEYYLNLYINTVDEDKKFVLMELIIQTVNEQLNDELFYYYWKRTKYLLLQDFYIHEYTIYYWSDWDNDSNEMWHISILMRYVWNECLN